MLAPSSRRSRKLQTLVGIIVAGLVLLFLVSPWHQDPASDPLQASTWNGEMQAADDKDDSLRVPRRTKPRPQENYAYVTFLSTDTVSEWKKTADDDEYFVATRILVYQFLHHPKTRTRRGYPLIVMVSPTVSQEKRQILARDGAIIREVEPMDQGWIEVPADRERWQSNFLKLHPFHFTEYDLIAFIDSDSLLLENLDSVFDDPAVALQQTNTIQNQIKMTEGKLPSDFIFATSPELAWEHSFPPTRTEDYWGTENDINSGFYVTKPSQELFDYYMSLTKVGPDSDGKTLFENENFEQSLLNYAHRREGNMPWKRLAPGWTCHWPTQEDVDSGQAKSLHEKWWGPFHKELGPLFTSWRWKMEGFFGALEELGIEGRDIIYRGH